MKHLAWLACVVFLTACDSSGTAIAPSDGGGGGTGGSSAGTGGSGGGPIKIRPDGSIVDPGTGGTTGGTGGATGTGGVMGGTGGAPGVDAGPDGKKDAAPTADADDCATCNAIAQAYADAVRMELTCDPTAANQCLKQTADRLVCGCTVWVNTTVLSDPLRQQFETAGCQRCVRFTACPAIACIAPMAAVCTPVSAQANPGDPARPIVAPPAERGQCMPKYQ